MGKKSWNFLQLSPQKFKKCNFAKWLINSCAPKMCVTSSSPIRSLQIILSTVFSRLFWNYHTSFSMFAVFRRNKYHALDSSTMVGLFSKLMCNPVPRLFIYIQETDRCSRNSKSTCTLFLYDWWVHDTLPVLSFRVWESNWKTQLHSPNTFIIKGKWNLRM